MTPTTFRNLPPLLLTAAAFLAGRADLPAAPTPTPAERPLPDQKHIQGAWRVVRVEANGKHLHREISDGQVWVFAKDRLTIRYPEAREETFAFELVPTHKPKTIDLRVAGLGRAAFVGIYELKGGRLTVCRARGRRPSRLSAGRVERGEVLFVLERVRK